VQPGDIVLADVKGRRFYATVLARLDGALRVHPLDTRITYTLVTARQVRAIWLATGSRWRSKAAA
jgi:hypothetical protein